MPSNENSGDMKPSEADLTAQGKLKVRRGWTRVGRKIICRYIGPLREIRACVLPAAGLAYNRPGHAERNVLS